jgi:hypothetical protein
MTPQEELANREDLLEPIGRTRNVPLSWMFSNLSQVQFDLVLSSLRAGELVAKAFSSWLQLDEPIIRKTNQKHQLAGEDWKTSHLKYPISFDDDRDIHLLDNHNEQVFTEIALKTSDVNRALGLTGQSGGQQPKMGPKVYAYLTTWHFKEGFSNGPEEVFAILEDIPELWEHGLIDGARGVEAVRRFMLFLEEFDSRDLPDDRL